MSWRLSNNKQGDLKAPEGLRMQRMTETCEKDAKKVAATQCNKGSSSDSKKSPKSISDSQPDLTRRDMTPTSGTTNAFDTASSDAFKA